MDAILQPIIDFIFGYIQQYPWFAALAVVVGSARLLFKPVMSILEAIILRTASKVDDAVLVKFKEGPIYWALNYILSLKWPESESAPVVPLKK